MMNQLGFEANEVGAEAVAHDGVRSFQFEAGDQLWLDRDVDQNRMSEDAGDRFAASLHFLRGDRTGNRQTDRSAIRAERCPGSLRELRQSRRNAVDKGGNAREPIVSSTECAPSAVTFWCFRAGTSCACSLRVGSASNPPGGATFCWHRRSLHPWIRAQPRRAGYRAVERHPSSG